MTSDLGLTASDCAASRDFYAAVLAPLMMEPGAGSGRLRARQARILIAAHGQPQTASRVAYTAAVDAFHAAALTAGGRDNDARGPRPTYHEHYYGAYVLDPAGNNAEAVCHRPPD